jgi:hypothetical protein
MLKIERKSDSRIIKAIIHRLADIPGGVTVSVANLGGAALNEGTPLCAGSDGMYNVVKTGKVVTAYSSGTSLEIAKGHHFKVGDKIADEAATMHATITAIDKTTNADKDVVTLAGAFSSALAEDAKLILVAVTAVNHTGLAYAEAANNVTALKVKKGHTIAVGDYIKGASMTGKQVTNIDRGSDLYDELTLGAATGQVVAADEALTVVTASNGTTVKSFDALSKQAPAIAIAGSNYDVVANDNLFVDAWLIAVVKEANGPVIPDAVKSQLSGIKYV